MRLLVDSLFIKCDWYQTVRWQYSAQTPLTILEQTVTYTVFW
jgi:hypothetical protein